MPCDTRFEPNETYAERKKTILDAIATLQKGLVSNRIKPVIDPKTGAIAFQGWTLQQRGRVSDACAYRRIMATGSALAKQAIAKAELTAGKPVNRQALAAGVHSHDGGASWGTH